MIKFNSYRDLIEMLFSKEYYFRWKNPAKNINLDYFIGKEKTKVVISFEYETRTLKISKDKLKTIKKLIRKENQK